MGVHETRLTKQIEDYLWEAGAYVVKFHGSAMGRAGIPDLLCCVFGKFVALEVKTPTGVVSKRQKWEHARIDRCGGHCFVVRSVDDTREIVEWLRSEG